jgi:hypothetical protein
MILTRVTLYDPIPHLRGGQRLQLTMLQIMIPTAGSNPDRWLDGKPGNHTRDNTTPGPGYVPGRAATLALQALLP